MVELGLWGHYAQTKRKRHRPWCEDGAYALGLGVITPHTMVGDAMVVVKNEINSFANRFFGPGMNVCRILDNFQHVNK